MASSWHCQKKKTTKKHLASTNAGLNVLLEKVVFWMDAVGVEVLQSSNRWHRRTVETNLREVKCPMQWIDLHLRLLPSDERQPAFRLVFHFYLESPTQEDMEVKCFDNHDDLCLLIPPTREKKTKQKHSENV